MHNIDIKNFGPVSNIKMDIAAMTFLLGELASGKSTIAKLVYFFRTAQEEFVNIISNDFEKWEKCMDAYTSLLSNKFTNIFGAMMYLGQFEITYYYSPDSYVRISPTDKNEVNIYIEKIMLDKLEMLL